MIVPILYFWVWIQSSLIVELGFILNDFLDKIEKNQLINVGEGYFFAWIDTIYLKASSNIYFSIFRAKSYLTSAS